MSCTKSVKVGDSTNYGVEVLPTGTAKSVRQTVYLPDGRKYTRYYNGSTWIGGSGWKLEGENLNLECKIVAGTVYIRHGELPEGCKIIMLRKTPFTLAQYWRRKGLHQEQGQTHQACSQEAVCAL